VAWHIAPVAQVSCAVTSIQNSGPIAVPALVCHSARSGKPTARSTHIPIQIHD
jgi:hypothetical protein